MLFETFSEHLEKVDDLIWYEQVRDAAGARNRTCPSRWGTYLGRRESPRSRLVRARAVIPEAKTARWAVNQER